MIKIAFVIDTIESPTAGTEKQLLLLLKHLDRSSFKPYLCVLQSSPWLVDKFTDCELFCADISSFKTWNGIKGVYRLSAFFRSKRIDIVQVSFRDASLAGIAAARLAGIFKIVATRRNQGYWLTKHELGIQKFCNMWVSSFIANSKATREWCVETEGIALNQIHVIYNALDFSPYNIKKNILRIEVREEFGIDVNSQIVCVVANLRPVKGHDILLEAAAYVSQQLNDVSFVLVGAGKELESLKQMTIDLDIKDRVLFLGRQQNIPRILAAVDVGVLSSRSESFSNALMEYIAAEIPVICTDVGGVRELVSPGVNGEVVEPGDPIALGSAILNVLIHKEDYRLSKSKEWLQRTCSISCVTGAYETHYKKLCSH